MSCCELVCLNARSLESTPLSRLVNRMASGTGGMPERSACFKLLGAALTRIGGDGVCTTSWMSAIAPDSSTPGAVRPRASSHRVATLSSPISLVHQCFPTSVSTRRLELSDFAPDNSVLCRLFPKASHCALSLATRACAGLGDGDPQ